MKAIFNMIVIAFFLLPSMGYGEVKEIIAEGTYNMGDGETPTVAESRALLQAKRVAIEQAGTYIESYSKVKNFQLTHDEIQVLASGVMEVTILDKKRTIVGDGVNFWVKIKAKVSTDEIGEMARKVKEKSVVEEYKRLQRDYENLADEFALLKKQLKEAKYVAEKRQVETKIAYSERRFQSNEWVKEGRKHLLKEEYDAALEAFTRAIIIDPDNAWAYVGRGAAYGKKYQDDMAMRDLNKAISIYPNDPWAYLNRGCIHALNDQHDRAIEDFNRAITIDPFFVKAYANRGYTYAEKGEFGKAFDDFDKAIAIDSNDPLTYAIRGSVYAIRGEHQRAKSDLQKACNLGEQISCRELRKYSGTPPNYSKAYKWVDDQGTVHFTDDYGAIPEKYKGRVANPNQ
jgi:tetratricopeptide (TPR) repeat protein